MTKKRPSPLLTDKEIDFLFDWLKEDLKLQEKEQTINNDSYKLLKGIVQKIFSYGLEIETKKTKEKNQLVQCIKDLDDYYVETIDNMSMYHHNEGLSEDDLKGNLANILENNGCYELVRENENNDR